MSSAGALVRGAGYLLLLGVTADSEFSSLVLPFVVIGIGTGLFFSPNNALLLAHAPPERAGMVSGLFGTLRQTGYALGFAVIASLFTVIQTRFELNWAYASLGRLPGHVASQVSAVFQGGGVWSPELLIFILRIAVLVCTAIVGLSLLNSLPRLRMNWRRQLAGALGFAGAAVIGTYVLAVVVPGALAVTAAEREVPVTATAVPDVEAFGMKSRAVTNLAAASGGPAGSASPFLQYCAACHGPDGRGLPGLGINLRESTFVKGASAMQLKEFLRSGRDASSPASRTGRSMPAFAWLPDEALEQVVTAVQKPGR